MASLEPFRKIKVHTGCKRKDVLVHALRIKDDEFVYMDHAYNGPVCGECSGEKGNCGCIHAEIRLLLTTEGRGILHSTYSPCTNCANAIVASNRFAAVLYDIPTEHDLRGIEFLRNRVLCLNTSSIVEDDWILKELRLCSA